jgi:1,2-dihydroxy-3-keto-5-methylthiopentene dioxygenase
MPILRIPDQGKTWREAGEIATALADIGIEYARVEIPEGVALAPAERVLEVFDREIARLKERGGYVTADVIDVTASTPGLDAMLAKFSREHWHDEDEVRIIVKGRGIFHIHPPGGGAVAAIEVEAGDTIRVPAGTHHWFDLCETREIRAIRLFRDMAGWVPRYTESGAERAFQPVCFGPAYLSA